MMRWIAVAGFVLLAACGGAAETASPPTTIAPAVTTTPAPTLPAGVGPLCAEASGVVVRNIANVGGRVDAATFDQPAFWDDFSASLDNCATRIEWLTSIVAQEGSQYEDALSKAFAYGCKKETFVNTAVGNVGGSPDPVSAACQ